jgi:glucan-binding YG repeat protein
MTNHQRSILNFIKNSSDQNVGKKAIVEAFGHWHYYNASFHIGETLSRMVKNGMIERVKKGVYCLGKRSNYTSNENAPTLFG